MANRPVFTAIDSYPYVRAIDTEFEFFSGFSLQQKQRSIDSLHEAFCRENPGRSVLEISSKSEEELGFELSAFNLQLETAEGNFSVETAFQSSKVFEYGGAYKDLLQKTSREAKKDPRLKNSGRLIRFDFLGEEFPIEPRTFFYDWLYVNALNSHPDLIDRVMRYDCFTDIEFNPKKAINCQARSVAMFVGLNNAGLLEESLKNKDRFLQIVYHDLAR